MRLQHSCTYDEVRRKSGPKRGYVKALEARLAQVETLLKTQDDQSRSGRDGMTSGQHTTINVNSNIVPKIPNVGIEQSNMNILPHVDRTIIQNDSLPQMHFPNSTLGADNSGDIMKPSEESFPWEMIGLGLDEPLPAEDVVNELNQIYFEKIQPSLPMIHRPRYYAAMNLAPHMRPPVCLRYAMWCNAAALSDKYDSLQEHFYLRARKYIQQDEMKGHGESMITIAHCQTWALLATYEFKLMYFPRAWLSAGRCCRLAQMMGLHRMDGSGLDVKQCLPPPKDWTEREERRRTFWTCFCADRYSSIGTGWPMTIEENDILTNLPLDDESYELSRGGPSISLADALDVSGASKLSSFAGVILLACLFGRNLTHLHRPGPDDNEGDLNGEFWKRHRRIDNILLNTVLGLPDELRLPSGLNNPNTIFMNMNIHTSIICLHQAAIFKADRNKMPPRISAESKVRCITAAAEIASIMRQISHLDLSSMNPFISFCLYVAARVFVQYLKSRPHDTQVHSSLQFLLSAMHAIKRKNPLTESFLVQLDVDLESAGLEDARTLRVQSPRVPGMPHRSSGCPTAHIGLQSVVDDVLNPNSGHPRPTYGDNGAAAFTNPNQTSHFMPSGANAEDFGYPTVEMKDYLTDSPRLTLPNRKRTPGSTHGSGAYRSPQSLDNKAEMDTSPDTGNDHRTPSSTSQSQINPSSHTSNTGYSPQTQNHPIEGSNSLKQDEVRFTQSFNPPSTAFGAEFDMSSFPTSMPDSQQHPGYTLTQNWSDGYPGMSTGMTPSGGLNDLMNMSDADWNQVIDGLQDWGPGLSHDASAQETIGNRRV